MSLPEWMSRKDAARSLGISVASVRRRVARGELASCEADDGTILVAGASVARLRQAGTAAPRNPGERTAVAFELLADGCSLVQLSIALRLTVDEARQIFDLYVESSQITAAPMLTTKQRAALVANGIEASTCDELVTLCCELAERARSRASVKAK